MKRFLLSQALMLMIVGSSFAQLVTITATKQMPAVGDTIRFVNANTFGFDPAGEGSVMEKVWDFSFVSTTGAGVEYWYEDATLTPETATFPNANLAYANDQEAGYFYYEHNEGSDTIYRAGVYSDASTWIMYDDKRVAEFVWPLAAGDNFDWEYEGDFAPFGVGEDSVRVTNGSISVQADMQGTMTMPNGVVMTDVLRVQVVETFHIKAYMMGMAATDNVVEDVFSYFYHDTIQGPICIYGVTSLDGSEESEVLRFQTIDAPTAINEQVASEMKLYPNPSKGQIAVTNAESIEVFDAIGRLIIRTEETNNITNIDLSNYENGVYIVRMHNGSIMKSERVIIEK